MATPNREMSGMVSMEDIIGNGRRPSRKRPQNEQLTPSVQQTTDHTTATEPVVKKSKQTRSSDIHTFDKVVTVKKKEYPVPEYIEPAGHPEGELARVLSIVSRRRSIKDNVPRPTDSVEFQMSEIDYVLVNTRDVDGFYPRWLRDYISANRDCQTSPGNKNVIDHPTQLPLVRVFGTTDTGMSVELRVHGFEPYLMALVPNYVENERLSDTEKIQRRLNRLVACRITREKRNATGEEDVQQQQQQDDDDEGGGQQYYDGGDNENNGFYVVRVEVVLRIPIRGVHDTKSRFLKITTALPKYVPKCRTVIEDTGSFDEDAPAMQAFEADVLFPLRFMINREITGCDWILVKKQGDERQPEIVFHDQDPVTSEGGCYGEKRKTAEKASHQEKTVDGMISLSPCDGRSNDRYTISGNRWSRYEEDSTHDAFGNGKDYMKKAVIGAKKNMSRCTIEVDALDVSVVSLGVTGERSKQAPMRVASIDTEWIGLNLRFPVKGVDPIITISTCLLETGTNEINIKVDFQIRSCAPIPGDYVVWFDDERTMLMAWKDLIVSMDPDIITGYNINKFDIPYMFERAKALGIGRRFCDHSRVTGQCSTCREGGGEFTSKAFGTIDTDEIKIPGRIIYDMQTEIIRNLKLRSYTLNYVAGVILNEQKEDVHYYAIPGLYDGNEQDRKKLVVYCKKDAILPPMMMVKRGTIVSAVEMVRVTRIPLSFLHTKGQQIKVAAQLYHIAGKAGICVDSAPRKGGIREDALAGKYKGATVLDPIRGYYKYPIATLDFASLYPSIMIAYNLCYSTKLTAEQARKLDKDDYVKSPSGDFFLKPPKYIDDQVLKKVGVKNIDELGLVSGRDYEHAANGLPYLKPAAVIPLDIVKKLDILVEEKDYTINKDDQTKVTMSTVRRCGILPKILQGLLYARGIAKRALAAEKDPVKKAVYDGRQLALKISANSVYGFTGATLGKLPDPSIASSVTSYGRAMIEYTKRLVECTFTEKNGYPGDARVLYGDTDSVMVDFGIRSPVGKELIALCKTWNKNMIEYFLKDLIVPGYTLSTTPETKELVTKDISESIQKTLDEHAKRYSDEEFPPGWIPETTKKSDHHLIVAETKKHLLKYANSVYDAISAECTRIVAKYGPGIVSVSVVNASMREGRISKIYDLCDYEVRLYQVNLSAEIAVKACTLVSGKLPKPMSLEFEKVFCTYVLEDKKRYAGWKWLGRPGTMKREPYISSSGLETVRRDSCMLVKHVLDLVLDCVIKERDLEKAIRITREAFDKLRRNDVSIDLLVISKSYSKKIKEYTGRQGHLEVVKKKQKRDAASAPHLGDRVQYVAIDVGKKAKAYERAEDPLYVIEHNLPIDINYYITKQLRPPLERLFSPIVPDVRLIFDPDVAIPDAIRGVYTTKSKASSAGRTEKKSMTSHKKITIKSAHRSSAPDGIGIYVKTTGERCLGCNSLVPVIKGTETAPALCDMCNKKRAPIYFNCISRLRCAEEKEHRAMAQCARCTGPRFSEVTCSNVQCPLYYAKIQASKIVDECRHDIKRFDIEDMDMIESECVDRTRDTMQQQLRNCSQNNEDIDVVEDNGSVHQITNVSPEGEEPTVPIQKKQRKMAVPCSRLPLFNAS